MWGPLLRSAYHIIQVPLSTLAISQAASPKFLAAGNSIESGTDPNKMKIGYWGRNRSNSQNHKTYREIRYQFYNQPLRKINEDL